MANANLTMGINGVDKTAAAFNSVKNRARATSAQIRSIMGGAMAAAGAFLGYRAISGTVQELGKLSDLAMKSGTSVNFLTSAATAFQVAGLDISVESLARSFQYLQKNTGKSGEGGFYEVVRSIAAIEDPIQRNAELIKNFGRAGLELQPLVNGGQEVIDKFETLRSVIPGVSDAAAQAGDEIADAQTLLGKGVETLWQKVVGKVLSLWAEDFPGGVRAGALNAVNWVETFAKKAYAFIAKWGARVSAVVMWVWDVFDVGLQQANANMLATVDLADREYEARIADADRRREQYKANLGKLDVDDLANVFGNRGAAKMGEEMGEAAARSMRRVNNQLIMGESNAARRLSILGPDYQNEQKKQTKLLERIEKNTADALHVEGSVDNYSATDLGL